MNDVETGRFTVAVFQDVAWAQKGLNALKQIGLPAESLTILAKAESCRRALIQQTLGFAGEPIELASVGAVLGARTADRAVAGKRERSGEAGACRHDAAGRIPGA